VPPMYEMTRLSQYLRQFESAHKLSGAGRRSIP
jgi:hypothetical protein